MSHDDQRIHKVLFLKNQIVTLLQSNTDGLSKSITAIQKTHISALLAFLSVSLAPTPTVPALLPSALEQSLRELADLSRNMVPALSTDELQRAFLLISASDAVQVRLVNQG